MIPITYSLEEDVKNDLMEKYLPPQFNTEETSFILDDHDKGAPVSTTVLINDFELRNTKTNKKFLKLSFSNPSGNIPAKMWDNDGEIEKYIPTLESNGVFYIRGQVDEFNGFKSVTVYELSPSKEDVNPSLLLASTNQNLDQLSEELFAYLLELQEPYQTLAFRTLDLFWDSFSKSPAAKGMHHNYLGGLLKHTVGLMRFCRYIIKIEENPFQAVIRLIHQVEKQYKVEIWESLKSEEDFHRFIWKDTIDHLYSMLHGMTEFKYDTINEDALMTSILFHDIGKLAEYNYAGRNDDFFTYLFPSALFEDTRQVQSGIAMDSLGVMVGHIPYGVLILNKVVNDHQIQLSMEQIHLMSHCILCHHGLPEWGSAVRKPQNIEGYIIHIVDYLDSRYENTEADNEK
nr:hydrolase [Gracilibacillus halotolerans]